MMSCTRASNLPVVVSVMLLSTAVAQHSVGPTPHPPAAPVRVYAPPVYHSPVVSAPVVRPPVIYAPVTTPRGLAVPHSGALRTAIVLPPVRPIRPIRRLPPIIILYTSPFWLGEPLWGFSQCWDPSCNFFWPLSLGSTSVSFPAPQSYVLQASEAPVNVYGDEREDRPQLYLKDGTILNVTDYWVVDNQLHFKVIEETGAKPVEQTIPFDELDLQKTVDANTERGFRFLLRNEPFEEYVRDHPEGPPGDAVAPHL